MHATTKGHGGEGFVTHSLSGVPMASAVLIWSHRVRKLGAISRVSGHVDRFPDEAGRDVATE
jgi:hypothetical protein